MDRFRGKGWIVLNQQTQSFLREFWHAIWWAAFAVYSAEKQTTEVGWIATTTLRSCQTGTPCKPTDFEECFDSLTLKIFIAEVHDVEIQQLGNQQTSKILKIFLPVDFSLNDSRDSQRNLTSWHFTKLRQAANWNEGRNLGNNNKLE